MVWQGLREAERKRMKLRGRIASMIRVPAGMSKMLQTSAEGRAMSFKRLSAP